jgi:hypothetical protein
MNLFGLMVTLFGLLPFMKRLSNLRRLMNPSAGPLPFDKSDAEQAETMIRQIVEFFCLFLAYVVLFEELIFGQPLI